MPQVKFARSLVDDIEFSPEDAGRSDPEFLVDLCAAVSWPTLESSAISLRNNRTLHCTSALHLKTAPQTRYPNTDTPHQPSFPYAVWFSRYLLMWSGLRSCIL